MSTISPKRIAALAGLLMVALSGRAEEKSPVPPTSPSSEAVLTTDASKLAPDSKPVPSIAAAAPEPTGSSTNVPTTVTAPPLPAAGSALLDLSNREANGATTSSGRQVGPETTIKVPPIRSLDERGGALRYLVREPKPGNLLQLINPFAPVSLGQSGRLVNPWSPIDDGKPLPRAFRDERTHEASAVLIGWP